MLWHPFTKESFAVRIHINDALSYLILEQNGAPSIIQLIHFSVGQIVTRSISKPIFVLACLLRHYIYAIADSE